MKQFFNDMRIQLGFLLAHLGTRLLGFKIVSIYVPQGGDTIRAMHFAENVAQLNSSMRDYVDDLDAAYQTQSQS